MKTTIQLRNSAINDLLERTPKRHYWMRDFAPEADREAARPLIQNFASIGLTPRELAAAEFLNAYANYEILDRELAPKTRDIDDRSPIEPIPEHKAAMLSAMRVAHLEAARRYEMMIADDKFPYTVRTADQVQATVAETPRVEVGEPVGHGESPTNKGTPPALTPAQIDQVIAASKKRESDLSISKRFGVSPRKIARVLTKAGLKNTKL